MHTYKNVHIANVLFQDLSLQFMRANAQADTCIHELNSKVSHSAIGRVMFIRLSDRVHLAVTCHHKTRYALNCMRCVVSDRMQARNDALYKKKARNLGSGCWRHNFMSVKIAMLAAGAGMRSTAGSSLLEMSLIDASDSITLHFHFPCRFWQCSGFIDSLQGTGLKHLLHWPMQEHRNKI